MNNLEAKYPYKGEEIKIYHDNNALSPDEWGDDECFIVYDHRGFYIERKGFNPTNIWEHIQEGYKTYEGYWVMPLYAYIHSGVSLSLGSGGCRWDTSMSGFVLVKRIKEWSWKIDQANKIAESLVEEWNHYLHGEVYSYITDYDSCGGYYGDEGLKQAIQEAKDGIDWQQSKTIRNHIKSVKRWIKSNVPLIYRKQLIL